jgi:hypothetical protein
MANITIEYMILIPVLILQVFLLPYAAGMMMNYWTTSSETIALQDASNHLSSSIQQLYFSLNNPTFSSGTVTSNLGVPMYINGYAYVGNASLVSVSGSGSEQALNITLALKGNSISTFSIVTLGQNAELNSSSATFTSISPNACINAYKNSNNTILLSFGT